MPLTKGEKTSWGMKLTDEEMRKAVEARKGAVVVNAEFLCWWCAETDHSSNDLKHIHEGKYWGERLSKTGRSFDIGQSHAVRTGTYGK